MLLYVDNKSGKNNVKLNVNLGLDNEGGLMRSQLECTIKMLHMKLQDNLPCSPKPIYSHTAMV